MNAGTSTTKASSAGIGTTRPLSLGSAFAAFAVAVSPWTGVRVAGVNLFDIVAPLAIVIILLEARTTTWRIVRLKWWVLLPTLAAVVVLVAQLFNGSTSAFISTYSQSTAVSAEATLGASAFGDVDSPVVIIARIVMSTAGVGLIVISEILSFGRRGASRVAQYLVAGVAVSAAIPVLAQIGAPIPELRSFGVESDSRGTGLAFHPNSFALSLVVVLPLLIAGTFNANRLRHVLVSAAGTCLVLVALFLADSRAGIAAGSVAAAWSAIHFGWRRTALRPVIITALAASPLLVGLYALYVTTSTRFSLELSADASAHARATYAQRGLEQWANSPILGVGLGNGNGVSVPILLASSGGILLVGAYALMVAIALRLGWPARHQALVAASAISVFGVLINGLVSNSYAERFEFVTLFIVAGYGYLTRLPTLASPRHLQGHQLASKRFGHQ